MSITGKYDTKHLIRRKIGDEVVPVTLDFFVETPVYTCSRKVTRGGIYEP